MCQGLGPKEHDEISEIDRPRSAIITMYYVVASGASCDASGVPASPEIMSASATKITPLERGSRSSVEIESRIMAVAQRLFLLFGGGIIRRRLPSRR